MNMMCVKVGEIFNSFCTPDRLKYLIYRFLKCHDEKSQIKLNFAKCMQQNNPEYFDNLIQPDTNLYSNDATKNNFRNKAGLNGNKGYCDICKQDDVLLASKGFIAEKNKGHMICVNCLVRQKSIEGREIRCAYCKRKIKDSKDFLYFPGVFRNFADI